MCYTYGVQDWVGVESGAMDRRIAALTALVLGLASSFAVAAPGSLGFVAPPVCPTSDWFDAELDRQGAPRDTTGAVVVRVEQAEPDRFVGTARYEQPGAPEWQRELRAVDCENLLSALAMSLAVHLESTAQTSTEAHATARRRQAGGSQEHAAVTGIQLESDAVDGMRQRLGDSSTERTWHWGLALTGTLRSGVDPQLSAAPSLGVVARSSGSGWGSGPVGVYMTLSPSSNSALVGSANGAVSWQHDWWVGGAAVTPGTFDLIGGVRMGPTLAFHAGRYYSSVGEGALPPQMLMFSELKLHVDRQWGHWAFDGQLGLHLPVNAFSVATADRLLHEQKPGLVVGLGASWLGAVL
jgi:hypothetical protein